MKKIQSSRTGKSESPRRTRGFTIIEILVVITILAVLLSIGAGFAIKQYRLAINKETHGFQQTILAAIDQYKEATGEDLTATTMAELFAELSSNALSRKILQNLPDKAIDSTNGTFLDSFGTPMRFNPTGGFGGASALIISNGSDLQEDTDDDIRSNQEP